MRNIIRILLIVCFSNTCFYLRSQDLTNAFKYKIIHHKKYSVLKVKIKNTCYSKLQVSPLLRINHKEPASGWGCDSIDISKFRTCYNWHQSTGLVYDLPDSMIVVKKGVTERGIIKYRFYKKYFYVQRIYEPITGYGIKIIIELDKNIYVKKRDRTKNANVEIIKINSFYE